MHACAIELAEIIAKKLWTPNFIVNSKYWGTCHTTLLWGIFDKSIKMSLKFLLDQGEDQAEPLKKNAMRGFGTSWLFSRLPKVSDEEREVRRVVVLLHQVGDLFLDWKSMRVNLMAIQPVHPELFPCVFFGRGMEILASYSFVGNYL